MTRFEADESSLPAASELTAAWIPPYTKIAKTPKHHPSRPSFRASLDFWYRAPSTGPRRTGTIRGQAWKKVEGKRLLARLGFPVAEAIIESTTIDDLSGDQFRGRDVVVKPVNATDSYGVIILYAQGSGWTTRERGEVFGADEIKSRMRRFQRRLTEDAWIVEELLRPRSDRFGRIEDTKFYTFYGHSPLFLQKENAPKPTYRWFDRKARPVDIVKPGQAPSTTSAPPDRVDVLMELANAVSRSLPFPFVRVDLYDTDRGPVCGELTLTPGGYYDFPEHVDHYLGCYFEHALVRLARDMWCGAPNLVAVRDEFPGFAPY